MSWESQQRFFWGQRAKQCLDPVQELDFISEITCYTVVRLFQGLNQNHKLKGNCSRVRI